MNEPTDPWTPEETAVRAYYRWEADGRPDGRADDHWFAAERELRSERTNVEPHGPEGEETREPLHDSAAAGPAITELDRALPPSERRRVRSERQGRDITSAREKDPESSDPGGTRFVVTLDRAHVRIYRTDNSAARSGQLKLELSVDLPAGKDRYTARESDQAGRFGNPLGGPAGASIDERLPMQEEHDRRLADELAARVESFLGQHPSATWDFAAGPALHNAVLDHLSPTTRQRLGVAVPKDFVNQSPEKWRVHFSPPDRPTADDTSAST